MVNPSQNHLVHPTKRQITYDLDTKTLWYEDRKVSSRVTINGFSVPHLVWETINQQLVPPGYSVTTDTSTHAPTLLPNILSKFSVAEIKSSSGTRYRVSINLGDYKSRDDVDALIPKLHKAAEELGSALAFARLSI